MHEQLTKIVAGTASSLPENFLCRSGMSTALPNAPSPTQPKSVPYPAAPIPNSIRASAGKSAHSMLAKKTKVASRIRIARAGGDCRTNCSPMTAASTSCLIDTGCVPLSIRNRSATQYAPSTDAALTKHAATAPIVVTTAAPTAGPTLRETLIETEPRATADTSSRLGTTRGMIDCQAVSLKEVAMPIMKVTVNRIHTCPYSAQIAIPSNDGNNISAN